MRRALVFVVVICLSAKFVSGDGRNESNKSTKSEKIAPATLIDKNVHAASANSLASETNDLKPTKRFIIHMHICEGDPKAASAKGNIETLSRPQTMTIEAQPCTVQVGSGDVPILEPQGNGNVSIRYVKSFDLNIEAKIWSMPNNKAQVSIKMTRTTLGKHLVDHMDMHTKTIQSLIVTKLGVPFTINLDDEGSDSKKQTWAEINVDDAESVGKKSTSEILPAPPASAINE